MNARTEPQLLARLSNRHLDALEEETIFILREVAATFERPALLFSGGKDSLVLLKCAEKAFGVGRIPYPLLMIDTGHNFPEVTDFRDLRAKELGAELIVRSVEDSIARGTVVLRHENASRNGAQAVTLLEAIQRYRSRLSGPLMDRIDLQLSVPRLAPHEMRSDAPRGEATDLVRARVIAARERLVTEGVLNQPPLLPLAAGTVTWLGTGRL